MAAATWGSAARDEARGAAASVALGYGNAPGEGGRVGFLTEQLLALEQVKAWKRALQAEVAKPEYAIGDLQCSGSTAAMEHPLLYCLADKMGIVASIKRAVIDLHCSAQQAVASSSRRDPLSSAGHSRRSGELMLPAMPDAAQRVDGLDSVFAARESWEVITREEMLKLAAELKKPLVAAKQPDAVLVPASRASDQRADSDQDEPIAMRSEGAQQPARRQRLCVNRFLYDGNDLLHALQAINPSNRAVDESSWGSIRLKLSTLSPNGQPRDLFAELAPEIGQVGMDELFPAERAMFAGEKNRVGHLVLSHHSLTMARQYAKTGCPSHLRAQMWSQSLSVSVTVKDRSYFQTLQEQADQWSYLTDDMYLLDLQRAIDSSDYFVFEDNLKSAILAFTRDAHVRDAAPRVNGAVSDAFALSFASNDSVPPNGVLPFSGLIMYLAPLTYLTTDTVEMYFIFREMYARYWSRLNCISSDAGTILHLCKLFEDLVARSTPAAAFHLVNAGISPLEIAFPWIQSAFSGVLEIQQVLLLWDRVVGFDSPEIIAYLAAALFHFRASELLHATTREAVDELFAELLEVQVVPLLQSYLFANAAC